MKGLFLLAAVAALMLDSACLLSQDRGDWRAASSNANSITGDLAISPSKVSINFTSFVIAPIRKLEPSETSAIFAAEGAGAGGNLYRLNVPASRRFLHHNTLCGSDDTQWMVTSVADRTLHVAFFSGPNTPVFTPEALNNSTDLCGTFTYVR